MLSLLYGIVDLTKSIVNSGLLLEKLLITRVLYCSGLAKFIKNIPDSVLLGKNSHRAKFT